MRIGYFGAKNFILQLDTALVLFFIGNNNNGFSGAEFSKPSEFALLLRRKNVGLIKYVVPSSLASDVAQFVQAF